MCHSGFLSADRVLKLVYLDIQRSLFNLQGDSAWDLARLSNTQNSALPSRTVGPPWIVADVRLHFSRPGTARSACMLTEHLARRLMMQCASLSRAERTTRQATSSYRQRLGFRWCTTFLTISQLSDDCQLYPFQKSVPQPAWSNASERDGAVRESADGVPAHPSALSGVVLPVLLFEFDRRRGLV